MLIEIKNYDLADLVKRYNLRFFDSSSKYDKKNKKYIWIDSMRYIYISSIKLDPNEYPFEKLIGYDKDTKLEIYINTGNPIYKEIEKDTLYDFCKLYDMWIDDYFDYCAILTVNDYITIERKEYEYLKNVVGIRVGKWGQWKR